MGERVEVGRIVYTVFETQWLTQAGEGATAKVPKNRFFVVRVSMANTGNSEVLIPALTIEDDKGNSYAEATDAQGVPQWLGVLRNVKPAEAAQGNVVFDVAAGHYKMRVTDENEEKAALIDIPLTFDAEAPELPSPVTGK